MARAIVHEMMLARRQDVDAARLDGDLLSRFGVELARAHELYSERVSPDLPEGGAIFRDAVNSILGEGERLL